jgi:hypothetical protein
MNPPERVPRVFISYSHDSPEHADRVLALADRLRAEGIDCHLDQYETSPPEGLAPADAESGRGRRFRGTPEQAGATHLREYSGAGSPKHGHLPQQPETVYEKQERTDLSARFDESRRGKGNPRSKPVLDFARRFTHAVPPKGGTLNTSLAAAFQLQRQVYRVPASAGQFLSRTSAFNSARIILILRTARCPLHHNHRAGTMIRAGKLKLELRATG